MKKYQDYTKDGRDDIMLTDEEFKNVKWTKFKIIVPTEEDKKELEEAFEHIHYADDVDRDYVVVNQISHHYLNESEGYVNNIIVDKELFDKLPSYGKADSEDIKKFGDYIK